MIIGIPVLNRRDLLDKCLASIDVPAAVCVIDNSSEGICADLPDEITVIQPPRNLGVAASWNLIVKCYPDEAFWVLLNGDVELAPGDLKRLAEVMQPEPMIATLVEFGAFAINAECLDLVGWFDEAFHPIYCEDADYEYRCHLAGVPIVRVPNESKHTGSVSYQSDPVSASENARTYPDNRAYFEKKWGGPLRGGERFTEPFDGKAPAEPLRKRIVRLAWRGYVETAALELDGEKR